MYMYNDYNERPCNKVEKLFLKKEKLFCSSNNLSAFKYLVSVLSLLSHSFSTTSNNKYTLTVFLYFVDSQWVYTL